MQIISKTKKGNWFEEQEIQEKRVSDFLFRKKSGCLISQQIHSKFVKHLKPIDRVSVDSEFVQFDSVVMLMNCKTNGVLSIDIDKNKKDNEIVNSSIDEKIKSVYRNCFVIKKIKNLNDDKKEWATKTGEDEYLHYGECFLLKLVDEDKYLFSKKQDFGSFCQYVSLDDKYSYLTTVWKCVYGDPKYRLEFEGEKVALKKDPLLIRHCGTNLNLFTGSKMIKNDFGAEWKVSCDKKLNIHKVETDHCFWRFL